MRHTRTIVLAISTIILAAGLAAAPVWAAPVINIGDSWSAFGHDQLAGKFPAGISVSDWGFPGATAQAFATDPVGMAWVSSALLTNPDAEHMFLSIGGNDLIGAFAIGQGESAAAIVDTYTRILIDNILAQRPNLKIVLPGYDFPNFEKEATCIAEGILIFGTPLAMSINPIFLGCIRNVQAAIAASYPNVTAVDAFYTLQIAGGTPGAPNPFAPSPASLMGGDGDCIHANSWGYSYFMGAIYDAYFLPIYGPGGIGCTAVGSSGVAGKGCGPTLLGLVGFVCFAAAIVIVVRRRQGHH